MKLYHVIQPLAETMLVSDKSGSALKKEAEFFLKEETRAHNKKEMALQIIQVTTLDQIPESWRDGSFLWNVDGEITPDQFLTEYQEYLRLKKKFE